MIQKIKQAALNYLTENLPRLKEEGQKSLSRRLLALDTILIITNNHVGTDRELSQAIKEHLQHIETGFFGRSQLRDTLTKVIDTHQTELRITF